VDGVGCCSNSFSGVGTFILRPISFFPSMPFQCLLFLSPEHTDTRIRLYCTRFGGGLEALVESGRRAGVG
jgi:hypothetical protein